MSAAEEMLPCFYDAGCHNYAQYSQFDVHHTKGFKSCAGEKLKDGAFVRHIPGTYNATWTDMFIESTYVRLGHCPERLEPDGFATCGELTHDATKMNNAQREVIHTHHKESQARIQNDNDDRCIIHSTLTMCINPLNDASHPDGALINILTGEICARPPPPGCEC